MQRGQHAWSNGLAGHPFPVEGIISHGLASVPDNIDGPVGVVGGRRTIAGGHYRRGLARPGRVVLSRVAQPLSAHIEAGRTGSPQFLADLARILAPLRRVDALVLACTHYPAASRWFAAALPDTLLIDPAEHLAAAIAERYPHTQTTPRRGLRGCFSPPVIPRRCDTARSSPGVRH